MWPWEHLAFGYVAFSVTARVVWGEPPRAASALVLAVAALLPDLVDKPLAWEFEVFASGYAAGHSVLVGAPVVLAAAVALRGRSHPRPAVALVVGYASHLVGDGLYGAMEGTHSVTRLLWPLVVLPDTESGLGTVARVRSYFDAFWTGADGLLVAGYLALLLGATALWLYDGAPGSGVARRIVPWVRRTA